LAKTTKKYETTFIIDPDLDESGFDERVEQYSGVIDSSGGEIAAVERWGMRKLAYRINHKSQGYYVHIKFTSGPDVPRALEKAYRVDEGVIRFLTVLEPKPWRRFPPRPESGATVESETEGEPEYEEEGAGDVGGDENDVS
jgi:small subunit ribosomal protein S6